MQEISRRLMEAKPSRMLNVLVSCGLIDRLVCRARRPGTHQRRTRPRRATLAGVAIALRILAGACRSSRAVSDFLGKLRVQQDAGQLARLLVELREPLKNAETSAAIVDVLERSDAFRRPERFEWLLQAFEAAADVSAERFRRALRVASESMPAHWQACIATIRARSSARSGRRASSPSAASCAVRRLRACSR
jgi:tRNA nucleotidyltransferase (CCA-adding enzyme)